MAAKRPEHSALNWSDLDRRAVDTVRVLAMDAVEKSGNGHPGTAMSLAPAAYLLFNRVISIRVFVLCIHRLLFSFVAALCIRCVARLHRVALTDSAGR